MTSAQTSLEQMLGVYKWVVDDVVSSMKDEFLNDSVDVQVLEDLKLLWESKIVQSGSLSRPPKESLSQKPDSHDKNQKSNSKHHQKQQQQQQQQQQSSPSQQQQQQGDVPLSVIQQGSSRQQQQQQQTIPQPPPLINLQSQNTSQNVTDSSRTQSSTTTAQPQSDNSTTRGSSGGSGTSVGASNDLLAQQRALYTAMAAGIQPLMLPRPTGGSSSLSLPMLPQSNLPMLQQGYAAVQTPNGLSYVPLPVALNLQQQQQQATTNKDSSSSSANITNIPQNDGPLPLLQKRHQRKKMACSGRIPRLPKPTTIPQLDGPGGGGDSSSEESDDSSESEAEEETELEEDDPLNSNDDAGSDEEENVWDTDNTIVCQFEKVYRVRAKWKFALKDGIMNLKGHDYIFCRVNGEADW